MTFYSFPPAVLDGVGVFGFCLYVATYSLLTLRVIAGSSRRYFALNLCASSCVLVGLMGNFNLASAMIQSFWVCMSVLGLTLHVLRPHRQP